MTFSNRSQISLLNVDLGIRTVPCHITQWGCASFHCSVWGTWKPQFITGVLTSCILDGSSGLVSEMEMKHEEKSCLRVCKWTHASVSFQSFGRHVDHWGNEGGGGPVQEASTSFVLLRHLRQHNSSCSHFPLTCWHTVWSAPGMTVCVPSSKRRVMHPLIDWLIVGVCGCVWVGGI